ncbi:MAG: hypothetical protein ACP5KN_10665, partial [Armatimonadota bacterium]
MMMSRSSAVALVLVVCTALGASADAGAAPRRLNSLVTELASVEFPAGVPHQESPTAIRKFTLSLEDESWLYIALQGEGTTSGTRRAWVTISSSPEPALDRWGETMRLVSPGETTVRLWAVGSPRVRRLVVRRVPEIMVYMFEGLNDPQPQRWITHSWEFLDRAVLHSANVVVGYHTPNYAPYARRWQRRGGRCLLNMGMRGLREEGRDPAQYWRDLLVGQPWDGVIHDELLTRDISLFPRYAHGLERFSAMPEARDLTVYLFCGVSSITDPAMLTHFIPDESTAAHGDTSLRFDPNPDEIVTARQIEVAMEPGQQYTLSAHMRTEDCAPGSYTGVFIIDEGWWHVYGRLPAPQGDSDWTRYESTFTPEPSDNGLYQVLLVVPEEGAVWVDAVQLERGGEATQFTLGEPNLLRNPSFEDGRGGWLRGMDRATALVDSVIANGHAFAPEVYMHEQPTEERARAMIQSRLVETMAGWRDYYEGIERHLLIVLSAGNVALRYSNDQLPDVSYKVLLDMQMHALATDPAFEDLRGVGFWSGHYIDEELMRWYGALFRHYCIQGRRTRLSDDPYSLEHLTNPGFEDGLEGWEVRGSVEAVRVAEMPQQGARGRYAPVPQGEMAVRTVRDEDAPNTLSQPIRNLEPGRLYSLKLYCADPDYSETLIPAQIAIEGGEVLPERTVDRVWQVEDVHWTMHYRVFRASAREGALSIS